MQKSFKIKSSYGIYQILISNISFPTVENDALIYIVDSYFKNKFKSNAVVIESTEKNKSLEHIIKLILKLKKLSVNRNTKIIAVGGGVIQDIVTFISSIYMRGLQWHYIPTTLLAMVDSCIGGKSSINVASYKNLIGNFNPPQSIFIDLKFIETLSNEQIIEGLCEAAKICYAKSFQNFYKYLEDVGTENLSSINYASIIERSLKSKKWFIEIDEFDNKERLLLNFGHTFGHAIEAGSDFQISHGIAVGLGMLVAIQHYEVVVNKKVTENTPINKFRNHIKHILKKLPNLSKLIFNLKIDTIIKKFDSDKKHSTTHFKIILPNDSHRLELCSIEKNKYNIQLIKNSYATVFNDF